MLTLFLLLMACSTDDVTAELDALAAELAELSETVDDQAALIASLEAENAALLTELESLQEGGDTTLSLEYTLASIPKSESSINYSQFDYAASFQVIGDADEVRILQHSGNSPSYPTKFTTEDLGDAQCENLTWSGGEELSYRSFVVEAWRGASYWCWEVEPFSEVVQTDCTNPTRVAALTCD